MSGTLISLNVARATPVQIGDQRVMTGHFKRQVGARERVQVHPLGLAGDEQADLSVHGGLSKAIYAYPQEHYPFWQTVRAQAGVADWPTPLSPGALGENLTITGLLEADAWIGDVLQFPDCALAISEPRQPCFKFNAAMGFKHAAKLMHQSGWCGFYLAVRREGSLQAGERYEVVPGAREVSIKDLFAAKRRRD